LYPQPEPDPLPPEGSTQDGSCSDPVSIVVGVDFDKVVPFEIESDPGNGFFERHRDQRESRISAVSGL